MKALPSDYRERVRTAFLSSFPAAEQEKALGFLEASELCPFRGQVKFLSRDVKVKKGNVETWEKAVTIVTGLDGCRSKAAATGRYLPDDALPVVEYKNPDDFHPVRATVRVRVFDKHTNAWTYAVSSCRWDEYAERKTEKKKLAGDDYPTKYPVGDGTKREHYQSTWAKLSETMLVKCAEVAVLRKAFPDELGGVYIEEEFSGGTPAAVAGDDPFAHPLQYTCAECTTSITAAQASKTIRMGDRHLCAPCEAKLSAKPAAPLTVVPPPKEEPTKPVDVSASQKLAPPPAPADPVADPSLDGYPHDAPPEEVKPPIAADPAPEAEPAGDAPPALMGQILEGMQKWPPPRKAAFLTLIGPTGAMKLIDKPLDQVRGKILSKIADLVTEWNSTAKPGKGGAPR